MLESIEVAMPKSLNKAWQSLIFSAAVLVLKIKHVYLYNQVVYQKEHCQSATVAHCQSVFYGVHFHHTQCTILITVNENSKFVCNDRDDTLSPGGISFMNSFKIIFSKTNGVPHLL